MVVLRFPGPGLHSALSSAVKSPTAAQAQASDGVPHCHLREDSTQEASMLEYQSATGTQGLEVDYKGVSARDRRAPDLV